ncbi:hypothetical protein RCL1_003227 [Eukaryota sp. TZLM3-RCL]
MFIVHKSQLNDLIQFLKIPLPGSCSFCFCFGPRSEKSTLVNEAIASLSPDFLIVPLILSALTFREWHSLISTSIRRIKSHLSTEALKLCLVIEDAHELLCYPPTFVPHSPSHFHSLLKLSVEDSLYLIFVSRSPWSSFVPIFKSFINPFIIYVPPFSNAEINELLKNQISLLPKTGENSISNYTDLAAIISRNVESLSLSIDNCLDIFTRIAADPKFSELPSLHEIEDQLNSKILLISKDIQSRVDLTGQRHPPDLIDSVSIMACFGLISVFLACSNSATTLASFQSTKKGRPRKIKGTEEKDDNKFVLLKQRSTVKSCFAYFRMLTSDFSGISSLGQADYTFRISLSELSDFGFVYLSNSVVYFASDISSVKRCCSKVGVRLQDYSVNTLVN